MANVTSRFGQTDKRSKDLVRAIRATPPPAGFRLLVGGGTAGVIDYADRLYDQFPRAAIIVVLAIYLVLLRTFGSVVIPLKAVAMNALSILASYGALVVIFQEGALADLLHFQPLGFVEASLPIVMFCVLFGLSMDYEVFLLSRIQEAHLDGADNATSVARGSGTVGPHHHQRGRHRGAGQPVVRGGRHRADQGARAGHGHRRVPRRDARARAAGAGDDAAAGRMELVGASLAAALCCARDVARMRRTRSR